jgi:hypothetical protein
MGSIIPMPRAAAMSPRRDRAPPVLAELVGRGRLGGRVVAGDEHVVLAAADCLWVDLNVGGHGAQRLDDRRVWQCAEGPPSGHRPIFLAPAGCGALRVVGETEDRCGPAWIA